MTATMKISEDEKSDLKQFMQDFWKLIRKYYIPEDPDSIYWDELVGDVRRLYEAYCGNELAKKLLITFLDYEDAEMKKLYPR